MKKCSSASLFSVLFFNVNIYLLWVLLFFHLFVFGSAGSLWMLKDFLQLERARAPLCGVQAAS